MKVDVDANAETAQTCGIKSMSWPTFQFYKRGEKIYEMVGTHFERIKAKIEELK